MYSGVGGSRGAPGLKTWVRNKSEVDRLSPGLGVDRLNLGLVEQGEVRKQG